MNQDLELGQCPFSGAKSNTQANEMCPFMNMQNQQKTDEILTNSSNNKNNQQLVKKKKQKGGCPVMITEKKRNPGMELQEESYEIIYVSPLSYLLDYQGSFSLIPNRGTIKEYKKPISEKRKVFDSYPIYLKHTIFHEEEEMLKIRKLEISKRFFVYDQFREQGNKQYYLKNYEDAVKFYERAMSCIKWIEVLDEEEVEKKKMDEQYKKTQGKLNQEWHDIDEQNQQNWNEQNQLIREELKQIEVDNNPQDAEGLIDDGKSDATAGSIPDPDSVEDEVYEEPEEKPVPVNRIEVLTHEESKQKQNKTANDWIQDQEKKQKEIKKKYKRYLTVFTDENTILKGDEVKDELFDNEMKDSLLFTIYLNISAAYMKLQHFSLAYQALQDAFKIKSDNSQALFRMAQIIEVNKVSTLNDLKQALVYIDLAIQKQPSEKIFQNSQPAILMTLNLQNVPKIYHQLVQIKIYIKHQKDKIILRIENLNKCKRERIIELFEREKEIEDIEKEIIEDGRTPIEYGDSCLGENKEDLEFQIRQGESEKEYLTRRLNKYLKQENQEFEIVKEMIKKYYQVIEFHQVQKYQNQQFQEQKRQDQVTIAKHQLQKLLEVYFEIEFYINLDFVNWEKDEIISQEKQNFQIDLSNYKILKRIIVISREKIRDFYSDQQFNFEIYKFALQDYFKKKQDKEKLKTDKDRRNNPQNKSFTQRLKNILTTKDFFIQTLFTVLLIIFLFYMGNNNKIADKLFTKSK